MLVWGDAMLGEGMEYGPDHVGRVEHCLAYSTGVRPACAVLIYVAFV